MNFLRQSFSLPNLRRKESKPTLVDQKSLYIEFLLYYIEEAITEDDQTLNVDYVSNYKRNGRRLKGWNTYPKNWKILCDRNQWNEKTIKEKLHKHSFTWFINRHPLSMMNEEWQWRDGDWRNRRGTTNTRTNSPQPLIWKESKILEPHLIYFPYSFWNRHRRFDIMKPTTKNDPSKYTFGLFFNTQTLHLEQALIQVWNPWRVRRGSVTIFIPSHTLFLWTILWILSYRNNDLLISWSYLLILSFDLISWSYLLIISYLTDDLI